MARSTYIYIVLDEVHHPASIAAAFTVKRELVGWLKRLGFTGGLHVYRVGDAWVAGKPVEMPMDELLGQGETRVALG